ncbi:unnamed protein product [Urochloa humidicola]
MAQFQRLLILTAVLLVAADAGGDDPDTGGCGGLTRGHYSRVFAFGDSLTDTGNAAIFPPTAGGTFTRLPYGETYFGHPSGRASDGRIITDFLVEKLKVPLPTPYLAGRTAADFLNGSTFAVGGATALDPAFLEASWGLKSFVPVSLSNETRWFKNVLQLLAKSHHEQLRVTASSVFFFGEIGINDYFLSLSSNRTIDETAILVPHVVGAIRSGLKAVVAAGARAVVATGMSPLGCAPYQLALFPGAPGDYDPVTGCNTRLNGLAEMHNRELRRTLDELRRAYPGRTFLYGDIYSPIVNAVASPAEYGFGGAPLAACCGGGGGKYNFNFTTFCGTPGSTACANPSESISWDGIHSTQAANRLMASSILSAQ